MKINRNITNLEQDPVMNGQVFEGVRNFRYLGAFVIKSRIAAGNRCFYSLRQILKSRAMS